MIAARDQVKAGRLGSLADAVRAETVSELLDQANAPCSAGDVIAATVIAGGALETHLLHLCTRHGIPFAGNGSISVYEGAIASARNAGTITLYDKSDSKHVTAWGGMRNDAARANVRSGSTSLNVITPPGFVASSTLTRSGSVS